MLRIINTNGPVADADIDRVEQAIGITLPWADFENAGGIVEEEPTEDIMIRLADDFDGFLHSFAG